jgi:hypothetical protein
MQATRILLLPIPDGLSDAEEDVMGPAEVKDMSSFASPSSICAHGETEGRLKV